jgi:hypothetical protein
MGVRMIEAGVLSGVGVLSLARGVPAPPGNGSGQAELGDLVREPFALLTQPARRRGELLDEQ